MKRNERQSQILNIVSSQNVESQQQLVSLLEQRGIVATQTTVSRDLAMLGIVKTLKDDGTFCYVTKQGKNYRPSDRYVKLLCKKMLGVTAAGNLIVVKTAEKSARDVADALERMQIDGVVGVVADSNTVLIVALDSCIAESVASKINELKK